MPDSDQELIRRVLASDNRDAFGLLVRRHQSSVRGYLRHLTRGDHALGDDLAQEVFIRAYRGLSGYRGETVFQSWLLGIAHNLWRNAQRKQRTQVELSETGPECLVPDDTRQTDLRADLGAALDRLPDDERNALHLGYARGLSHPEIAATLGCPLGTVKTHLARGKEKLRILMAAWNPTA